MQHKNVLPFILPFFLVAQASLNAHVADLSSDKQTAYITVFVHGAISIKPYISIPNFIRLVRDNIENSLYKETVFVIRDDPFFFQNQPMQERGLRPIDYNDYRPGAASSLYARLFDEVLKSIDQPLTSHFYYTGGWSGLLSPTARYQEAYELYQDIKKELNRLREIYGFTKFYLRFIGYSHGGNVCLNLGAVHDIEFPDDEFTINQLILIGTPVQFETDIWAFSPVFEKIYHFYSYGDRVQKLDCFSLKRFLSHRKFHYYPSTLKQIQLKVTDRVMFSYKHNKRRKPRLKKVDISPGHTELWFPGWTPENFRKTYPFYPIPAVLMVPLIINEVDKLGKKVGHILAHIDATTKIITLTSKECKCCRALSLSKELLDRLTKEIHKAQPVHFTKENFDRQVYKAIDEIKQQRLNRKTQDKKRSVFRRIICKRPCHCLR